MADDPYAAIAAPAQQQSQSNDDPYASIATTPPPSDYLSKAEDFISDAETGVTKSLMTTGKTLRGLAERVAPYPTSQAHPMPQPEMPKNAGEATGMGLENIGEFMLGGELLGSAEGATAGEKLAHAGQVAKLIEKSPQLKRALEIGMTAMKGGGITAVQKMLHGSAPSEAVKSGAEAAGVGAAAGAAFEGLNALRGGSVSGAKAVSEAIESGSPRAEAGQAQIDAAKRIRETQGMAVGAAKGAAMPEEFRLNIGPTTELQKSLDALSDSLGTSEGLESLKDPEVQRAKSVIDELNPNHLRQIDRTRVEAIRNQLNSVIDQQQKAVASGNANGTALGYYKQIKKAFDEEMYLQIDGAKEADALKAANKQYATTVQRQTKGPASPLFKAKTPELVIKKLNSKATDGTMVSEFLADKTPEEVQSLRNGALKDLAEESTSNGKTDWNKVLQRFEGQRDAAKTLYGSDYDELHDGLVHFSKNQNFQKFAKRVVKYAVMVEGARKLGLWRVPHGGQ
jgi:hypothetical protein